MDTIIHHSIADLHRSIDLPTVQDMEFSILSIPDIHPQIPFKSPKLRADYFSFILTKDGSGTYFLDDTAFGFGSQSFYFTNPGHLKAYELRASKEAYIIMLTESFLKQYVHPEIFGEFPFLLVEKSPPKSLTNNDFDDFERIYHHILTEFRRPSKYRYKILGNLMMVVLLKIKDKYWSDYDPLIEGKRDSQIVKNFKRLLEVEINDKLHLQSPQFMTQASHFAQQLNLHPNYLNAVIKSKTGRTTQQWIAHQQLIVAKTLLLHSTYSSKEIAYQLGFSEPTHFSRFFKKHTDLSPTAFRQTKKN